MTLFIERFKTFNQNGLGTADLTGGVVRSNIGRTKGL